MTIMCWYGRLYDFFLGALLRSIRQWIADRIRSRQWFPVLDLCCGTGDQLRRSGGSQGLSVGLDKDFSLLAYARSRSRAACFVCADAEFIPFQASTFQCVVLSFSLHEKSPGFRTAMLKEAERVTRPAGRLLILDYEKAWNAPSRLGGVMIWLIERIAGGEHFRFFRQFMAAGGLDRFVSDHAVTVSESRWIKWGSCRIVLAKWP
jgi:ubiquinone/menaquinone biosynthesis C-methylase UbiE